MVQQTAPACAALSWPMVSALEPPTLASACAPPCIIPTPPTFGCALLGAYAGYSPLTHLPGSSP
eukprot:2623549-Prymnesium_polylepis.1